MSSHPESDPRKEQVFIYDMSPELEAELLRRARDKGTAPGTEAEGIIERHVEEEAGE